MLRKILFSTFLAVAFVAVAPSAAKAQDKAIVTYNNYCLIPDGSRVIKVFKCTDGGIRYTIVDGFIKTSDNFCFDHGIPRGQNSGDRSVKLVRCHGGLSQKWYVIKTGAGKGLIQNAVNPDVCLNIKGGNDAPGGEVLVWPCGFNRPANNEYFFVGDQMTRSQFVNLNPEQQTTLNRGGGFVVTSGPNTGAHMVAAGGGNMVAAGGGNMVAAGSLNLIGNDGSTFSLAQKLVGNDGASIRGASFRIAP